MVYETFLKQVEEELARRLGEGYLVTRRKVPKNNGLVLDGLCIGKVSKNIAPTIYLNSYYDQLGKGMSMGEVVEDILSLYQENKNLPNINLDQLAHLEQIQDKIAYKLIHAQSNQDLLKTLPHMPYLDLAIVFYLFLEDNDQGQMTAMIHHGHLESWRLTLQELYHLAEKNTPRLLPAKIKTMKDVMKEIAKENLGSQYREDYLDGILETEASPLYVLTNQRGIHGSCCILYQGVLKGFAQEQGNDLVVLPSSIHEVLLVPHQDNLSFQDLRQMVAGINKTEVPKEDQLSNEIYLYSKADDRLSIPPHSSPALGKTNP